MSHIRTPSRKCQSPHFAFGTRRNRTAAPVMSSNSFERAAARVVEVRARPAHAAPPFDSVAAIVVCRRVESGVRAGVRCGVAALCECRPWLATARGVVVCAALRARGARRASVGAPAAANGFLELVRCCSSRACVCVAVVAPAQMRAPTAVLRLRGPRVGRPRVIDVDLARRRRRPRPPARRTSWHAAGGREVCDPRGAHGASGQRCVPAHGLRCRCCCGAVRQSVGRVRVCSVACVALVLLEHLLERFKYSSLLRAMGLYGLSLIHI